MIQKPVTQLLATALNQEEYRKLHNFFLSEMPKIIVKDLDQKPFEQFTAKLGDYRDGKAGTDKNKKRPYLNMMKVYNKLSTKSSHLMKGFATNYLKLLKQAMGEGGSNLNMSTFFIQGEHVV